MREITVPLAERCTSSSKQLSATHTEPSLVLTETDSGPQKSMLWESKTPAAEKWRTWAFHQSATQQEPSVGLTATHHGS